MLQNASLPDLHELPGILRHLRRLTGEFIHDGQRVAYIRVYSCLPDGVGDVKAIEPPLEIYPAADQGLEGIACVDDVARAVVLALQVYEMTSSEAVLHLAMRWLHFVTYMQNESDRRLLNFILDDSGTRNGNGATSFPGGEPWTVRALQAFARAWCILRDEEYLQRFWNTPFPATGNMKYTSSYALAVMDIYQTQQDRGLRQWIVDMCDQIIKTGPGFFRDECGNDEVELYGYYQLAAVARAGQLLGEQRYIDACKQTVEHLAKPVIEDGFYSSYPSQRDKQCPFDLSPIALGLEALYQATGESTYRDLALSCVAWFEGANPSGKPVYHPEAGRCCDKVHLSGEIESKTGAEAAIEAGSAHLVRCRLEGLRTGLEVKGEAVPI